MPRTLAAVRPAAAMLAMLSGGEKTACLKFICDNESRQHYQVPPLLRDGCFVPDRTDGQESNTWVCTQKPGVEAMLSTPPNRIIGSTGPVEKSREMPQCRRTREAARFQIQVGGQPHTLWLGAIPRNRHPSTRHATLGVGRVWKQRIPFNHSPLSTSQKSARS
jgi:hypothetical protein